MWEEDEVELLHELYDDHTNAEIGERIDRSAAAVKDKAGREGLSKPDDFKTRLKIRRLNAPTFEDDDFAHFVCGFVAGEGSFVRGERLRFQIIMADDDAEIVDDIHDFFGVGNVYDYDRDIEEWKGQKIYTVQSIAELVKVIIPFFDEYGFYSAKKQRQYEVWREEVIERAPVG